MFAGYLMKRIVTTLIIFFVILNFQFLLFWVVNPIEPVQMILDPSFTPEVAERLRASYGLNDSLSVQYVRYITNMLTFNLGVSFHNRQPVTNLLMEYLPNTLMLVLTATIILMIIGISFGLYVSVKRGKVADLSLTGIGLVLYSTPSFLFLLLFRYIFAEKLRWFPVLGIPTAQASLLMFVGEYMYRMTLPLVTLICIGFGSWAFYTRNLAIDALTEDYMQTARAKGVRGKQLMFKHVFRAILPPIATLIVISLPTTIFGSIVTEYIFTWKGIGWWYLNSLWSGDYPSVQGLFFVFTLLLLGANLLADLLYGYLDPRVRVGGRR